MGKKKKKKKGASPESGLIIVRGGNNYGFSWKLGSGSKDYTGQTLTYQLNGKGKWYTASGIGRATTSKAITNITHSYNALHSITAKVQAKTKKKKLSPISKTIKINPPKVPTEVSLTLDGTYSTRTNLTWRTQSNDNDLYPQNDVYYQSMLLPTKVTNKGSIQTPSEKDYGPNSHGYVQGTANKNGGTISFDEDATISEKTGTSYTRWVRIRARGPGGHSAWVQKSHIYGMPNQAIVTKPKEPIFRDNGYECYIEWESGQSGGSHPIDSTKVQYSVVIPSSGLSFPISGSWTDAVIQKDINQRIKDSKKKVGAVSSKNGARFIISGGMDTDYALFYRVNNLHDGPENTKEGKAILAKMSPLTPPEQLVVSANEVTHKATISAQNKSQVADSFLVVVYRNADNPNGIDLGIIPHGETQTIVDFSKYANDTTREFGVYAACGLIDEDKLIDGGMNAEGAVTYNTFNGARIISSTRWKGGEVPAAPLDVSVEPSTIEGTVIVRWDWSSWPASEGAEISWADHEDAWMSTNEPQSYSINRMQASEWHVSGLSPGNIWYFRVRLTATSGDTVIVGAWSDIKPLPLYSAPNRSSMVAVPSTIPPDGSTVATWAYVTGDGTSQGFAEICKATFTENGIEYGEPFINTTGDIQTLEITAKDLGGPGEYQLCLRTQSTANLASAWSDPISVKVADPLACTFGEFDESVFPLETIHIGEMEKSIRVLKSLPLTVNINGAGANGITRLLIVRDGDYVLDRPDEDQTNGYDNETIFSYSQNGEAPITVDLDNETDPVRRMYGTLDDGASYILMAFTQDGVSESKSEEIPFMVKWDRQAMIPSAETEIMTIQKYEYQLGTSVTVRPTGAWSSTRPDIPDGMYAWTRATFNNGFESYSAGLDFADETEFSNYVAKLRPVAPSGVDVKNDTCDIYRLSLDKPELIYSGAIFGNYYIDPYPTIGENGGHRFVYKTENGDYITEDNVIAWTDTDEDDGDILNVWGVIIDFGNEQIHLKYDISFSNSWEKSFTMTEYLGGKVRGDWNAAVKRNTSVKANTIVSEDIDTISALRKLAEYRGVCHIRTPEGSSFDADIQVRESREEKMVNKKATFDLTVSRIEPTGLDGMLYEEWVRSQEY